MTPWKKFRYRLEWLALMAALKVVPLLSRGACYRLAGFAGSVAARFDARGRRVALSNLESALGDELTPARRKEIVRQSYGHFARTMLDLFWSPRLNAGNFSDYVELEGVEEWRAATGPSRRCIVGAFHYGNFEWLSLACGWVGFPGAIATEEFKNPLLLGFFQKLRDQSGNRTVARDGAIIRLYKMLRKGGPVALLVDTTLPPHYPTVVIDCFGLKTIVTVAHAWLQERTGVPLVPMHTEALPGGRYRVVVHPAVAVRPGATHQEIAQACWDSFEPVVRRDPAPWLWMYKHWRYKPAGAQGYPFYSQESDAFEQIAARRNYAKLDRAALEKRVESPS
ncbi:MAG: lysophospholipid acyltransferase family protein [Chthoniobacterales bacterium]